MDELTLHRGVLTSYYIFNVMQIGILCLMANLFVSGYDMPVGAFLRTTLGAIGSLIIISSMLLKGLLALTNIKFNK